MRIAALLSLLLAIVPACGTQQELDTTVQAATVRATLDSLWSQYAVAADRRDSVAFGNLFLEDAVLVTDHTPTTTGREAIARLLAARYVPVDVTAFRVRVDDLRAHGPLAIETGDWEEDFTENGAARTSFGRFALVAEPDAHKIWKVRRLMAYTDSTAARPPA
jgi:ketosteroid isomerase-like protein